LKKTSRVTAGQTKNFKHVLVSRDHHDRIATLAIRNDTTLTEQAAVAFQHYFDYLDRVAASRSSKRA